MRELAVFLLLVLLFLLAVFGGLGEVMLAATTFPLFLATVMAIGLGVAELGRRWLRSRGLIVAGLAFALGFLVLRFVELTPVKPFREFFRDSRPGITKAAVLARLEQHFPAGGAFRRPVVDAGQEGRLLLTLDPRRSSYNSEVIDLYFEGDALVRGRYYID